MLDEALTFLKSAAACVAHSRSLLLGALENHETDASEALFWSSQAQGEIQTAIEVVEQLSRREVSCVREHDVRPAPQDAEVEARDRCYGQCSADVQDTSRRISRAVSSVFDGFAIGFQAGVESERRKAVAGKVSERHEGATGSCDTGGEM